MQVKTITLSVAEWEIITDALCNYCDQGPIGEGWKSRELSNARDALDEALDDTTAIEI